MVFTGEDKGDRMRIQETVRIPYTEKGEEDYIWLPVKGEASFLFPFVRKAEGELIYNIEGLSPLSRSVSRDTEPIEVIDMIRKVLEAKPLMESFLIGEKNISWNPEYIYWHIIRREVLFIYLPDGGNDGEEEFWKKWAMSLLKKAIEEDWKREPMLLFILRFNQWTRHMERLDGKHFWAEYQTEERAESAEIKATTNKNRKKPLLFLPRR